MSPMRWTLFNVATLWAALAMRLTEPLRHAAKIPAAVWSGSVAYIQRRRRYAAYVPRHAQRGLI